MDGWHVEDRGNPWDNSYAKAWDQAGKEGRSPIAHLPVPLYTDSFMLSRIQFIADPKSGSSLSKYYGHDIQMQFEVFGCSNYDIDKSKFY